MKIRNVALVCASVMLATASFAEGETKPAALKHVDNIYIWGPANTVVRVVEIGPVDATLDVKLINDHQIRVSRSHMKHGTWTGHVALNETDHCVFTIEAGMMNQKVTYTRCTDGWEVTRKRSGMYNYNLHFTQRH